MMRERVQYTHIFTRDKNGKIDGLKMYTLEGMYDKAVRMP